MRQRLEESAKKEGGTILFYGIPAYGHLHSNLYFAGCLSELGFRVVYYSVEHYRREIEANGCEYRAYPLGQRTFDPTDGDKLLKLYRLILEYSCDMLPDLLCQARQDRPGYILFDSLALWGRAVGKILSVPAFGFYSIAAIDRVAGKAFWAYIPGFGAGFLRYAGEMPQAIRARHQLKQTYGIRGLGVLPVLMNRGTCNLMGYSRLFQPGGTGFGNKYVFLGPLSPHRKGVRTNDFDCPDGKLIYISLGTVFNQDEELLHEVLRQFGQGEGASWNVVMVWDTEKSGGCADDVKEGLKHKSNFIVRSFADQGEVLRHADLFVCAAGMNSIHEALYYGVPCLMCPQQGEQLVNAKRFETLGFGKILKDKSDLYQEAMAVMKLKYSWNETLRHEMTEVHMESALQLFGVKQPVERTVR